MSDNAVQPSLALDEQLCFAVYSASRAIVARYRPLLDELGLTYPQYLVLLVLWESGPATVGELGARLNLDSGTLSPLLKRLESRGIVSRRRRSTDERSVEITLTSAGHQLREHATCVPAAFGAATGLNGEGIVRLRDELRALADTLRTDSDEPDRK